MRTLNPARVIGGSVEVPGDKSIAQRLALISVLAEEPIEADNFPINADCHSALRAAEQLGVTISRDGTSISLTPPSHPQADPGIIIDCGNSGTTARLLAGLVSGTDLEIIISGDQSLSSRPMKRIVEPLTAMGAELIDDDGHLPLKVRGKKLLPFEYRLPIPSAQIKSAVLLAGAAAGCSVTIREDLPSRDHTELLFGHLGKGLECRDIRPVLQPDPDDPRKRRMIMPEDFRREIRLAPRFRLSGGEIQIPGDFSTAAFFFGLAAISGKTISVTSVGINPTRTAFLDYLRNAGCRVEITNKSVVAGEPRADVSVTGDELKPRRLSGEQVIPMLDEVPMAAVVAAHAQGTTVIRDARELRVKETDRIAAVAENLERMGCTCGVLEDGLAIEGGREYSGADFVSFGDHRIAMAFAVAALSLSGPSTMDDDTCIAVSCPGFYELLGHVTK